MTLLADRTALDVSCRVCGAATRVFFEALGVPVHSVVVLGARADALAYPRGDVRLAVCELCGLVRNASFDPDSVDYTQPYEEAQGYSPTFTSFARELAADLVETYDVRDKDVLEIGCGKAQFLELVCELGGNLGVGIDPSVVASRVEDQRVHLIADHYTDDHAVFTADLVCNRHTLEHVLDVRDMVRRMRAATRDGGVVFVEVPDVWRVLRDGAFWDVYHEHCTYFSIGSLGRLFASEGFDVLRLERAYEEQYLLLDARPSSGTPAPLPRVADDVADVVAACDAFAARAETSISRWGELVEDATRAGRRVTIWGAGSKGVTFITMTGVARCVPYAVDINPYKRNTFLPGTGTPVIGPEDLAADPPDDVIVMNPVYLDEIRATLDSHGLHPRLYALS